MTRLQIIVLPINKSPAKRQAKHRRLSWHRAHHRHYPITMAVVVLLMRCRLTWHMPFQLTQRTIAIRHVTRNLRLLHQTATRRNLFVLYSRWNRFSEGCSRSDHYNYSTLSIILCLPYLLSSHWLGNSSIRMSSTHIGSKKKTVFI